MSGTDQTPMHPEEGHREDGERRSRGPGGREPSARAQPSADRVAPQPPADPATPVAPVAPFDRAEALATVRHVARLARLRVSPEEAEHLAVDFARILAAFRVLAEAEVDEAEVGGAQATGPAATPAVAAEALRPDEPRPSLPAERLLGAAPRPIRGYYGVPRTVPGAGAADAGATEGSGGGAA